MLSPEPDLWASGAAYESYVGRWSSPAARIFLAWLKVQPGARWLDVGCGTGALSREILAAANPRAVHGVDFSLPYLEFARRQVSDPRAAFFAGSAQALGAASGVFAAAVSALALNFFPSPAAALDEMVRVTRGGGPVAAYVWDYAGQMEMIRFFWDAAAALDPRAAAADEGRRFPLCQPGALRQLFQDAGLEQVEVLEIVVSTGFKNYADYWTPFLSGQGPAPGYVRTLDEKARASLRERLRGMLPVGGDGSIALKARAWAVQGMKPAH